MEVNEQQQQQGSLALYVVCIGVLATLILVRPFLEPWVARTFKQRQRVPYE